MKKILVSLMTIALVVGITAVGFAAYFDDTETSESNTFTAGTLDLDDAGFATFDLGDIVDNMAPGDLSDYATITIENTGSLDLAWFGDWVITGGDKLREAIYIDSMKMEFVGWTEPTDQFITDGVGSGPYPGWYDTLATQSNFGVVSLDVWDGNAGMAPGTGYEHMGALVPGNSYKLTVRFGFAPGAGNEYQGDVVNPVTIVLRVDATQVNAGALEELQSGLSVHLSWMNTQIGNQATP